MKPCIVCKKPLEPVFTPASGELNATDLLQPDDALSFEGAGAYGSRYDESPVFAINICDDCFTQALKDDVVYVHNSKHTVTHTLTEGKNYLNS